jgi:D-serine deaminase-like pyridoxal phosphate-dependent protein
MMDRPDGLLDLDQLPTPAVVLAAAKIRRNIERLAAYAAGHGIAVRPHTKTHKSVEAARLQLAAGAHGLTVAKVGEAESLLSAFGASEPDLFTAYPAVDPARTSRLAALARTTSIRVAVDAHAAIEAIAAAATGTGSTVGLLVDLDLPVPVRQWVISVLERLRGFLADRPQAVAALASVFLGQIERLLGHARAPSPFCTASARHSTATRICVRATDGAFMPTDDAPPAFLSAQPITQADLATLTEKVRRHVVQWFRMQRLAFRRGAV